MFGYLKAVKDQDEQVLVKTNRLTIVRFIAAIIFFCIPYFVNIIVKNVDPNGTTYASCLNSATAENISKAYRNQAEKALDAARESLTRADYGRAESLINKIKDASDASALKKELEEVKKYVEIRETIYEIAKDFDRVKFDKVKKSIESIKDESVKERLKKEITEAIGGKGTLMLYVQDPNDPLYRNLKNFNGTTLKTVLETNGSSVDKLNNQIKQAVEMVGVGTREAPIAAALTLMETLAGYGYRINYDWAGKHYHIGVNGNWGARYTPWACDSYPNPDYCKTKLIWRGFDCSGFVHWALIQGFQDESLGSSYPTTGEKAISLAGKTEAVCDVGDNLFSSKHTVLVAGVDEEHKRYLVTESSGGGVKISWYSFNSADYYCRKLKYKN